MMYIWSLWLGKSWRMLPMAAERTDEPIVTASVPAAADISELNWKRE
jgi:hypothetical protein